MMTTRDSSMNAIAELRTLRLARVQERARDDEERHTRALAERAAAERAARVERLRATRECAQRTRSDVREAPRISRTTIERIACLREELGKLASERVEGVRARAERIDVLNAKLIERRSHWVPIATGLLVAGAVFGGLVAQAPHASVASGAIPEAPATFEQALEREGRGALPEDVSEAAEVALLEEAEIPLLEGDAGVLDEVPVATPAPAPQKKKRVALPKKRKRTRVPATRGEPAERPVLDSLGNLADCGDDPICGLGF